MTNEFNCIDCGVLVKRKTANQKRCKQCQEEHVRLIKKQWRIQNAIKKFYNPPPNEYIERLKQITKEE